MTISYNLDIPDGPNNPSNDQPKMKTNTNSINSWTSIDHVEFGSSPAGTHKQTTFSSKNVPGIQTDPQSVLYTNNGTAFSTIAQLFYRNQSGIFPISIIRAFGSFLMTAGNTTQINGANYTFLVNGSGTNVVVTLTANVTTGTNFIVLPSYNNTLNTITYTKAANQITFNTLAANAELSFIVLQI